MKYVKLIITSAVVGATADYIYNKYAAEFIFNRF